MNEQLINSEPKLHKWKIPIKSFWVVEAENPADAQREFTALKELHEISPIGGTADEIIGNAELDLEEGINPYENHNQD